MMRARALVADPKPRNGLTFEPHWVPDPFGTVPWVHRTLPEQFLPFAASILIAHLADVSLPVTAAGAMVFFAIRMIGGVALTS